MIDATNSTQPNLTQPNPTHPNQNLTQPNLGVPLLVKPIISWTLNALPQLEEVEEDQGNHYIFITIELNIRPKFNFLMDAALHPNVLEFRISNCEFFSNSWSLKNKKFTPSSWKDKGFRKVLLVLNAQFLINILYHNPSRCLSACSSSAVK